MQNRCNIVDAVRDTVLRYHLIYNGDTIMVAVSGGPDSVALLHCLLMLAPEYNLHLVVAHVNHELRGEESDKEQAFTERLARDKGLTVLTRRENARELADKHKLSLEEAARRVRYDNLIEMAWETNADAVALGHHKNDRAETILIQLLRGSGRTGLAGFQPRTVIDNVRFVRPFYDITRDEINDFLEVMDCEWCVDSSNIDRRFLRNKIRLDLIPLLEKKYNPNLVDTLARTADILGTEDEYLDRIANGVLESLLDTGDASLECIPVDEILSLPYAVSRRVARMWLMQVLQTPLPPPLTDIETVLTLCESGKPGNYHVLSKRVLVYRDYEHLFARHMELEHITGRVPRETIESILPQLLLDNVCYAGYMFVPVPEDFRLQLHCEELLNITAQRVLTTPYCDVIFQTRKPSKRYFAGYTTRLEIPRDDGVLEFRTARKGDRLLHFTGSKSLRRYFTDIKIPNPLRHHTLILAHEHTVLWIPGIPESDIRKAVTNKKQHKKLYAIVQPQEDWTTTDTL